MPQDNDMQTLTLTNHEVSALVTATILCEGFNIQDASLKSAQAKLVQALGIKHAIDGLRKEGTAELRKIIRSHTQ